MSFGVGKIRVQIAIDKNKMLSGQVPTMFIPAIYREIPLPSVTIGLALLSTPIKKFMVDLNLELFLQCESFKYDTHLFGWLNSMHL